MNNLHRLISRVLVIVVMVVAFNPLQSNFRAKADYEGKIKENVTSVYFRESAGGTPITDPDGNVILLDGGHALTVLDTTNSAWYKVSLVYGGKSYSGYVASQYVEHLTDVTTGQNESTEEAGTQTGNDNSGETSAADAYEQELANAGFPQSYWSYLKKLHELHPDWEFKAVNTGIEWDTLVANEINKTGQIKNLIYGTSSYPHYNWRSTSVGYSFVTDKWSAYDGTTWYAASDDLVAYYLDPRTYLYENYIFVFESLSYQEGVQNQSGVEAILKGTFMYKTNPYGEDKTYSQIIMEAAKESGVSPYHIASRIKLEMGSTAGTAALGNSKSYPGIYNYFNIGANDSSDGSALLKGLAWAASSGSYGRPWNTVYKSIVGGAKFIGASYISVGQNTLYTQKFNVTNKGNLFSHQYMTNIQAPATECLTNYNAYNDNNLLNSSMLFEIPVYKNMPSSAVTKPADSGSPNNWLKNLSVNNYLLTPTFSISSTTNYSLIVLDSVSSVKISASAVNGNAVVKGTGEYKLNSGTNVAYISVTAQNGDIRTYTITIVKGNASNDTHVIDNGVTLSGNITDTSGNEQGVESGVTTSSLKGDINGDGKISVLDIVKMQRIIVGLDAATDEINTMCDLNGDSKVSVLDIVVLQRHIVGIDTINQ